MTAVLIPASTEAEWLEARRKGVTASEIAVLMGLSPYSSPYALYHKKLGTLPEQDETDAMALGKHMESFVAAKFAERHPEFCLSGDGQMLFARPDRLWQMATPDRIVGEVVEVEGCTCGAGPGGYYGMHERGCGTELAGPVAVLECKIDGGSDEWGDDGTDEIPVHYRCQVLWQMDVMGVGTGYVACLLWHRRKVQVYEITLNDQAEADLKLMREEAEVFLGRLASGCPPDIDWRPATAQALKRLHPGVEDRDAPISTQLAQRYQAACRNLKAAERKRDRWANEIRAQIGPARYAIDRGRPSGQPSHGGHLVVARRDVYPVREHVRKASVTDRLVAVAPPKEKPACGS